MPKEQYMCQLCANHGIFNQPKKGHKQKCPHRNCPCSLCALNTKRRALDQIERQLKSNVNDIKTENPDMLISMKQSTACSQLSPTSVKLPATVSPPSSHQQHRQMSNPSLAPYCVALPATISRRDVKLLKREEPSKKPTKTLEAALENIHRHKSIFHSAEQLAGQAILNPNWNTGKIN